MVWCMDKILVCAVHLVLQSDPIYLKTFPQNRISNPVSVRLLDATNNQKESGKDKGVESCGGRERFNLIQ